MKSFRYFGLAATALAAGTFAWSPLASAQQAKGKPAEGWSLHIDAIKHLPYKADTVAHHYCKANLAGGLTQCQLYDGDAADARLVGAEAVVSPDVWKKLPSAEKARWHYHKTEIAKVKATLPDLSPEEAAKVAKSLEESYGKIYVLWDPARSSLPTGRPTLTILK